MDGVLRVERVSLLGLVTLLGATTTLPTAVAALGVSAVAAAGILLAVAVTARIPDLPPGARWVVLVAAGFGVSWVAADLAPVLLPVRSSAMVYLRLAGVAPILFLPAVTGTTVRAVAADWAYFAVFVVKLGVIREVFGVGTIWGYLVLNRFTIPADFMAAPVGAFLLIGAGILGTRLVAHMAPRWGEML